MDKVYKQLFGLLNEPRIGIGIEYGLEGRREYMEPTGRNIFREQKSNLIRMNRQMVRKNYMIFAFRRLSNQRLNEIE